jgi:hypothetical protein
LFGSMGKRGNRERDGFLFQLTGKGTEMSFFSLEMMKNLLNLTRQWSYLGLFQGVEVV